MGMAPAPADLERQIAAKGRGVRKDGVVHRSARDTSPPQQKLLRQMIVEHDWKLFTWLLDTCELSARDERVWKVQRRMLLDGFHKHEEVTRGLINQLAGLTPTQILEMAIQGNDEKTGKEDKTDGTTRQGS